MKFITTVLSASLAIAPITALAGPDASSGPSDDPALRSQQQCFSAWNVSSARNSCRNTRIDFFNGTCTISTDCARSNGTTLGNYKHVPLGQVSALANCNGLLRVGGC